VKADLPGWNSAADLNRNPKSGVIHFKEHKGPSWRQRLSSFIVRHDGE